MANSKAKAKPGTKSKSTLQSVVLSGDAMAKAKVKAKSKHRVRSGPGEVQNRGQPVKLQKPNEKQKDLQKGIGDSKTQLQLEEKKEQEQRDFGRCRVCCKDNEHFSSACPYWNGVPPGAIVGDVYGVVIGDFGRHPFRKPGDNPCAHPGGQSEGRLVAAYCHYCKNSGLHWSGKCPERPKDKPYKPLYLMFK